MLRTALLVVSIGMLLLGVGLWVGGVAGAPPFAVWGAILLLAVVFERWRYEKRRGSSAAGWQVTDERFVDPETGRAMQVLYDPRTGERRYEPLGGATGPDGVPPAH